MLGGKEHQYINFWLCMFIIGGSSKVSHIPVVLYLPYGNTANFKSLVNLVDRLT